MKSIKKVLIASLICAFGVVGASTFAHFATAKDEFKPAAAEETTGLTRLFIETPEDWESYSVTKVYYFGANLSANWSSVSKVTGYDHVYNMYLPAKVDTFILVRKDSAYAGNNDWNNVVAQTANIPYSSEHNYYKLTSWTGKTCSYERGWMNDLSLTPINTYRVTIVNEDYDWFDSSAKTTLRFWDGHEFTGTILNFGGNNSSTVEFSINTTVISAGFNIFRKSADLSETWSQTTNWTFTYENKDMNALVIRAKTGDAQYYDGEHQSKVIDNDYRAMSFGIHFLNKTNSICNGHAEDDNYTQLNGVWSYLNGVANNVLIPGADAKTAFKTSEEAYTSEAFTRYSHIVNKYRSLTDFIGDVRATSVNVTPINNTNNANVIIILISVLALAATGSFFFIRRRKTER